MTEEVTMHHNQGGSDSLNNNVGILDDQNKRIIKPTQGASYQLYATPYNMTVTPINVTVKFYHCKNALVGTHWSDYTQIGFGQGTIGPRQSAQIIASKHWVVPKLQHTCLVAVAQTASDPGPNTNPANPYTPHDRHVGQYNFYPVPLAKGTTEFEIPFAINMPKSPKGRVSLRATTPAEFHSIREIASDFDIEKSAPIKSLGLKPAEAGTSKSIKSSVELAQGFQSLTIVGSFESGLEPGQVSCLVISYEGTNGGFNETTYILYTE